MSQKSCPVKISARDVVWHMYDRPQRILCSDMPQHLVIASSTKGINAVSAETETDISASQPR